MANVVPLHHQLFNPTDKNVRDLRFDLTWIDDPVHLNLFALQDSIVHHTNPLLDPERFAVWLGSVRNRLAPNKRCCWGGYNEIRTTMWRGSYLSDAGDDFTHLGIDFWVPRYAPVYLPRVRGAVVPWRLVMIEHVHDQRGGWGGRLIFQYADFFIILAHVTTDVHRTGNEYQSGDLVAYVDDQGANGGWSPHLHVQIELEYRPEIDGYAYLKHPDFVHLLHLCPDPKTFLEGSKDYGKQGAVRTENPADPGIHGPDQVAANQ